MRTSDVVELVWIDRGVDLPDWSIADTSRVNEGIFAGIGARVSDGESRSIRDSPSDEDCEIAGGWCVVWEVLELAPWNQ